MPWLPSFEEDPQVNDTEDESGPIGAIVDDEDAPFAVPRKPD